MARVRTHREWFRTVFMKGRKSCPSCRAKLEPSESIWSWGEYIRGKWHTVDYLCRECWPRAAERLVRHRDGCGCQFEITMYGGETQPAWMTLPEVKNG